MPHPRPHHRSVYGHKAPRSAIVTIAPISLRLDSINAACALYAACMRMLLNLPSAAAFLSGVAGRCSPQLSSPASPSLRPCRRGTVLFVSFGRPKFRARLLTINWGSRSHSDRSFLFGLTALPNRLIFSAHAYFPAALRPRYHLSTASPRSALFCPVRWHNLQADLRFCPQFPSRRRLLRRRPGLPHSAADFQPRILRGTGPRFSFGVAALQSKARSILPELRHRARRRMRPSGRDRLNIDLSFTQGLPDAPAASTFPD